MLARRPLLALSAALVTLAACRVNPIQPPPPPALTGIDRGVFNETALRLALPLFWLADEDRDGALEARELAVVWGLDPRPRSYWVDGAELTVATREAFERVRAAAKTGVPASDDRRQALRRELGQSFVSVIDTDLTGLPAGEKAMVSHVLAAAAGIERLYARQLGSYGLERGIPPADTLSRLVFFLNQGPWCSGSETQRDPACAALEPAAPRLSGLYPADLQADKAFCQKLAKERRHDELLAPFSVVARDAAGALVPVPYTVAFAEDTKAVSGELAAAAQALGGTDETALAAYLAAASRAFGDNDWFAADEAWARMSGASSKWFLRVGPDEVYFEPCSVKAGFHLAFGRQSRGSQTWQRKLEPVKNEMEQALAAMAGPPYAAREVAFHLPEFVDIVLNAGDSREPRDATVGQSLPNWGPVATEGRGRTVAMTNFYADPESRAVRRAQASAVLCADAMARYADDGDATVLGTVLHEAAHNLGPAAEYRVGRKLDADVFGGPRAAMLEELKAQTSALYLADWLVEHGLATAELAERAHLYDLTWALGHVSRGTRDADGKLEPYGALAAIQVGTLFADGAVSWRAAEPAANGKDEGCLAVDFARFSASIARLEARVLAIKARGDAPAAAALEKAFVEPTAAWGEVARAVTDRYLRFPRPTYLYSVRL